jgi:hemerythrin-like domain-containing protein
VLGEIEATGVVDPVFIDTAVDFVRTYADRTHHGKEEDILFRALRERNLSETDKQLMEELIEEHVFGRKTTQALVNANLRYLDGETSVLQEIQTKLKVLVDFYPKHIEKEDKVFFPASRNYFTEEEDQAMLEEFREFDSKMIHEKYGKVVENLGNL